MKHNNNNNDLSLFDVLSVSLTGFVKNIIHNSTCVKPKLVINLNSDFVYNKQTSSPLSMINSEEMCYFGITDKPERTSSTLFILFTVNLLPRDQTKHKTQS
jgi:hypothetical protein